MKKTTILLLTLILLSIVTALYFYPQMPQYMATHWNVRGEVDGYSPKLWAIIIMPVILTVTSLLFTFLPKMDPLRKNYQAFSRQFETFIVLIALFLFYMYALTIAWNLGNEFNFSRVLAPAFAALFYYIGVLLAKAKRNWFVGIKTPWTLTSDRVWEKTHTTGSKLFKISAVIALSGVIFSDLAFFLVILPAITAAIYLFFYSWYQYRTVEKQ